MNYSQNRENNQIFSEQDFNCEQMRALPNVVQSHRDEVGCPGATTITNLS